MNKNPYSRWTDKIPLLVKMLWRESHDFLTKTPEKKFTTEILNNNKTIVILGSVPHEEKVKLLQRQYPNKQFHFVSFIADDESKSTFRKNKQPINSKTKIPNVKIHVLGLFDHTIIDLTTGKILKIAKLLELLDNIPNDSKTVLAFNCNAGKGRSVVGTAAWLMYKNKMPLLNAMQLITEKRRVAETIKGANSDTHRLLNPQATGYLGYIFIYLLNTDIQNKNLGKDSLLSNSIKEIKAAKKIDKYEEYLHNSLSPVLAMPLNEMETKERENLTLCFNNVMAYLKIKL